VEYPDLSQKTKEKIVYHNGKGVFSTRLSSLGAVWAESELR
jgi:hypothetical protein